MWYFHADHHQPKYAIFERNDIFCNFAAPSIALFYWSRGGLNYKFFIGLGIMFCGVIL
jgi:beta-carotene 3-hydroxylase